MPLSLNPAPEHVGKPETKLVMGWLAITFGVLGIFTKGYIFVPLAFVCSLVALVLGQGAQWIESNIGYPYDGFPSSSGKARDAR